MVASMGYELPPGFRPDSFENWFTPAGELTHAIDVTDQLAAKRAAMAAHRSQATTGSGDDGVRTLALLLSLPDEWFSMAFATEWYVQPGRTPGSPAADIFASVTGA
jgi:LmbE family N-acetylglucosaminyl deacetylase